MSFELALGILEPTGYRTMSHRIDVHHRHAPPELSVQSTAGKPGKQPLFDWTPTRSIEDMDRAPAPRSRSPRSVTRAYRISKAQTSHCRERSPTWFGYDHAARKLQ
jgi:hypothetical protein